MRAAIASHLRSHHVARVVYGSIIGLAIVLALEAHPPAALTVVATLLGTALAVALAEVYADVLGLEVRTRGRIARAQLAGVVADGGAVAFGVGFPAVFFGLAAAGAFELDTAFTIARWSGLGLIAFYGFCAARLAGRTLHSSIAHGLAVGLVGGAIIALKALTH